VSQNAEGEIMPRRHITAGERQLLRSVFQDTLPYEGLEVDTNDGNWGGEKNSITPEEIPHFATGIFCSDFSASTVNNNIKTTFIHEFMHVWQFYHGVHKVLGFLSQAIRHPTDYGKAYPYDLSDSNDLLDFNFEQQAAIIADYWRLNEGERALRNIGRSKVQKADYSPYAEQVRSAGGATLPWGQRQSWVGPNVK
jgi:hypothetical protein